MTSQVDIQEKSTRLGSSAVIIGGGISGLSAAFFLSQKSDRERVPLRISLLEASDRWGGVVQTLSREDLRIEAGADAFDGGSSETMELCRVLGLEKDVVEAPSCFRNFFYLTQKEYFYTQGFPKSWKDVLAFLGSPRLSLAAKGRMLMEPIVPRRRGEEDESVASFVRRRFGRDFYQEVVMPLVRGVYMADPERASLKALFSKWRQAEDAHGSIARAILKMGQRKSGTSTPEYFTLRQGLGALPEALVRALAGCELRSSTPVRQCVYDSGWNIFLEDGKVLRADILGLAMNACDSSRLLSVTAPALSRLLSRVRYDPIMTVSLAFVADAMAEEPAAPGFWVPEFEGVYPFSSFKWLGKSADGKYMCARAFISETLAPDVFHKTDELLGQEIGVFVCDLFGIRAEPHYVEVKRYPQGLPQYEVGHLERIAEIEKESARTPGLFLAGNGLRGFGITDCICRAKEAVSCLQF